MTTRGRTATRKECSVDRREWLEARRKGIGGSDVAPIFGLSKYRTAIDVYEDKLGLRPERAQTAPQRFGLLLEDAVARAFVEDTGILVRKVGMRRAKHVSTFPMIGSIDRAAYGPNAPAAGALVEIKTSRIGDGYAKSDEWRDLPAEKRVPVDAYLQTQHYLEVSGYAIAFVVVLVAGSELRVIEIPRDPAVGDDLIEEEGRFWNEYIAAGVVPPVSASDQEYLRRRFPEALEDEVVATAEIELALDRLFEVEKELDALGTEKDTLKARLKEYIGSAKRLVAGSGSATWSRFDRTTTSWKEYAAALEGAAAALAKKLVDEEVILEVGKDDALASEAMKVVEDGFATLRGLYTRTAPGEQFTTRKKEG